MDIFSIEYQYQEYLKRVKVKESDMQPDQKREMKRAFFGAVGQTLVLLRDEGAKLKVDQYIKKLDGMMNEIGQFWQNETNQQN